MRIEQATIAAKPKATQPARRRTKQIAISSDPSSAVTNPGEPGADEATYQPIATTSAPRRQSKRAVPRDYDNHVSVDSAASETKQPSAPGLAMSRSQPIPADQSLHENRTSRVSGADRAMRSTKPKRIVPDPLPISGQSSYDTQSPVAGMNAGDDGARISSGDHSAASPVIARIQQLWRMRQRWHRAEKALTLQGKAVCRSWTNGDKEVASKLFDAIDGGDASPDVMLQMALKPFLDGIEQFRPVRKSIEKELQNLAKQLPIASWIPKGFGALNLAAVVGEAGDVGSYRNPSCLWKRMGLAVINGERQRKKSDAEQALAHGYNPSRRAVAYLLGDTLIKGNGDGPYRAIYLQRKEYELARTDDGKPAGPGPGHAHNRAARYMVKRVLRDMWQAWRRTKIDAAEKPTQLLSGAELSERETLARDQMARAMNDAGID